jgi:hypothetical protein
VRNQLGYVSRLEGRLLLRSVEGKGRLNLVWANSKSSPFAGSLFPSLHILTLRMEGACSSETLVFTHRSTCQTLKDHSLINRCHENLKTYIYNFLSSVRIMDKVFEEFKAMFIIILNSKSVSFPLP